MKNAKLAWLLGIVLALAGFVPVLVFAVGTLVPAAEASAVLGFLPELPWRAGLDSWLHVRRVPWSPPAGLVYALPGLAIMYIGAAIARRQDSARDAASARQADARRRAHLYGGPERIEPTLGAVE